MSLVTQRSDLKMSTHTLAGTASYTTGGYALNPKSESGNPNSLAIVLVDTNNATWEGRFDYANNKVILIVRATGAEVANAVNVSALTAIKILAIYA